MRESRGSELVLEGLELETDRRAGPCRHQGGNSSATRADLPLWLATVQVCVMPVGPVQDEAARALVDDLCMAGLGAAIEEGDVQVIDVAADFKGSVSHVEFIDLLSRSRTNRVRCIEWPYSAGRL